MKKKDDQAKQGQVKQVRVKPRTHQPNVAELREPVVAPKRWRKATPEDAVRAVLRPRKVVEDVDD